MVILKVGVLRPMSVSHEGSVEETCWMSNRQGQEEIIEEMTTSWFVEDDRRQLHNGWEIAQVKEAKMEKAPGGRRLKHVLSNEPRGNDRDVRPKRVHTPPSNYSRGQDCCYAG